VPDVEVSAEIVRNFPPGEVGGKARFYNLEIADDVKRGRAAAMPALKPCVEDKKIPARKFSQTRLGARRVAVGEGCKFRVVMDEAVVAPLPQIFREVIL